MNLQQSQWSLWCHMKFGIQGVWGVPCTGRPAEPDVSPPAPAPPHLSYMAQADVLILLLLSKFKEFTVFPEQRGIPIKRENKKRKVIFWNKQKQCHAVIFQASNVKCSLRQEGRRLLSWNSCSEGRKTGLLWMEWRKCYKLTEKNPKQTGKQRNRCPILNSRSSLLQCLITTSYSQTLICYIFLQNSQLFLMLIC